MGCGESKDTKPQQQQHDASGHDDAAGDEAPRVTCDTTSASQDHHEASPRADDSTRRSDPPELQPSCAAAHVPTPGANERNAGDEGARVSTTDTTEAKAEVVDYAPAASRNDEEHVVLAADGDAADAVAEQPPDHGDAAALLPEHADDLALEPEATEATHDHVSPFRLTEDAAHSHLAEEDVAHRHTTSPVRLPDGAAQCDVSPALEPEEAAHNHVSPALEPEETARSHVSPALEPEETARSHVSPALEPEEAAHSHVSPALEPEEAAHSHVSPALEPEEAAPIHNLEPEDAAHIHTVEPEDVAPRHQEVEAAGGVVGSGAHDEWAVIDEDHSDKVMHIHKGSVSWQKDDSVTACTSCSRPFTLVRRRHHCRHCGRIFCSNCCSRKMRVGVGKEMERACEDCYSNRAGVVAPPPLLH